ncbi:ADP-ribosylglycohydrolase family protein [Microscilla marina]|uniref:Putative ADP-ribosylglycohydrolase n=1 Tax=Microscilla marina ATCC 23134 TaxID=313606 RepID=A1ZW25_MICM2|nr:ADP-ribosylglycohydrolase family protein [Microscilla marina]EAY25388.1 putative ADP-ribosylglycohydrolase [Microscilla marina ATCC 23134]
MKTFWIDRFDHVLSREEFAAQEFMSVVNLKDKNEGVVNSYLRAEQKVLRFLLDLASSFEAFSLIIERQHLHQIIANEEKDQQWLHQLERVTLHKNTNPTIDWHKLFVFALRENIRLTIQTPEYCLRTGYELALFVQTSQVDWLKYLVSASPLFILNELEEEEDFWQIGQERYRQFSARQSKVKGAIYGMAVGDGLGAPAEFLTLDEIKNKRLPNGFFHASDASIKITDDTQMALAVGQALHESEGDTLAILEQNLRKRFVQWLNDSENNRAPGMTCLTSCERLEKGMPWQQATNKGSKGCGANMRVLPVGLLRGSVESIGKVAQFQAVLTHAHPTALAAAELTAVAIRKLLEGVKPADLIDALTAHVQQQLYVYHEAYLEQIWDRPPFDSPAAFISTGWLECLNQMQQVRQGLQNFDSNTDPCIIGGAGWTAEESFATALYCFLSAPDDPVQVLQRAICTSGDSDSIACLAGGLVGAAIGVEALPQYWLANIEYKEELAQMARFLA